MSANTFFKIYTVYFLNKNTKTAFIWTHVEKITIIHLFVLNVSMCVREYSYFFHKTNFYCLRFLKKCSRFMLTLISYRYKTVGECGKNFFIHSGYKAEKGLDQPSSWSKLATYSTNQIPPKIYPVFLPNKLLEMCDCLKNLGDLIGQRNFIFKRSAWLKKYIFCVNI